MFSLLHLLAEELGLRQVHFYHGRAEDFCKIRPLLFDIVTLSRTVARMQFL